jgi:pimeloyl-ACP methyl ester carboxylesterase
MLRRLWKIIRYAFYGFTLLLFFLLIFVAPSCMSFRMSEREVRKYFQDAKVKPTLHRYKMPEREMHYAEIGSDSLPTVIFVHGSPGSWSAWVDFFKDSALIANVKMVAVDRPGFGHSGYARTERSLQKQVELLKPVLEKYQNSRPVILVGHSLGGPLIARIVMDYPDFADGLVYVAPSIDPALEKVLWYQRAGDFFLVRWLLPGSIKASNQEILPLKGELEKMLPMWKNITQRSVYIHGTKDQLVPVANTDFAKRMLTNAPTEYVIVEGMNHFVPWSHPQLIREAILKLVKEAKE